MKVTYCCWPLSPRYCRLPCTQNFRSSSFRRFLRIKQGQCGGIRQACTCGHQTQRGLRHGRSGLQRDLPRWYVGAHRLRGRGYLRLVWMSWTSWTQYHTWGAKNGRGNSKRSGGGGWVDKEEWSRIYSLRGECMRLSGVSLGRLLCPIWLEPAKF